VLKSADVFFVLLLVLFVYYSDQLLTARSHVTDLKRLFVRLSELEKLFRGPHPDGAWSVGTALGEVTAELRCALSTFDDSEIFSDESTLSDDDLLESEETKRVDDGCRELRESIMLVVQSLYKTRDSTSENQTEDRQIELDEGNGDSVGDFVILSFNGTLMLLVVR